MENMSDNKNIAVDVRNLRKDYGSVTALRSVDLQIEAGEYFVLLGPSGGGKTTLLRLIGGFVRPTAGTVRLHGQDVSELPPERRPTSMVFQSYALFPHMNVAKNVGYGLRLQRRPAAEIAERVAHMLDMVGLTGLGDRAPHELSGGQQQRVQLARSLVLERDILLLDEPLAALDAKLRKDMCFELKHLQEKVGITFVHVTHNQEEAMTVADRIAIIADGELVEAGTAKQIYESPQKRFTADFIGENNLLNGVVAKVTAQNVAVDLAVGTITVPRRGVDIRPGADVTVSIRSEQVEISQARGKPGRGMETLAGVYVEPVYLGLITTDIMSAGDRLEIAARKVSGAAAELKPGQKVRAQWQRDHARLHVD
jgi:ABC-type Fe3+/spermidine/putrescine transport system ATPase subunit